MDKGNNSLHRDIFQRKGRVAMFDLNTYDTYMSRIPKVHTRFFKYEDEKDD